MVGLYDNQQDWHTAMQMGVANYGQMTAGGWMYIGPQGIVHGTFNTLLNAGRLKLGIPQDGDLRGRLFVSSGLGGMSGAQPKAAEIVGSCRYHSRSGRFTYRHPSSSGMGGARDGFAAACLLTGQRGHGQSHPHFHCLSWQCGGSAWYMPQQEQVHIDLLSDQTSCHAAYDGGYCPAGLTFEERTRMLHENPAEFRRKVDATLQRHFDLP